MNCLHSFRTNINLNHIKNKDFCSVGVPSEDTKILEFNQYQKSGKTTFIIYADLESLIEKIDGWKNNPEKLSLTKVSEPNLSSFSCL